MSARHSRPPAQSSNPYGHHGAHAHHGSGNPTRVSPSPAQLPRLPSLSSWAHDSAQTPPTANEYSSGGVHADAVRPGPSFPYQGVPANYQPVDSGIYPVGPASIVSTPESSSNQTRSPDMCFRGGPSPSAGYGVPRLRPVARKVSHDSDAPLIYRENPSRHHSNRTISYGPKESVAAPNERPGMQVKRRATSPASQLPLTKRTREQSPPIIRPQIRTREVVPNLLGSEKAHLIRNLKFSLKIRQQPQQARSCGFADKDRRAIDPPPIVELKIEGDGLSKQDLEVYMNYDRYVMCCTLLDEKGVDAMNMEQDGLRSKRMMGENTVVPFVGTDEHGEVGCFFSFNDLSCRTPGDYRLSFSVSALPTMEESRAGVRYPRMTDIVSDIFKAYNAKLFPGMTESSALARALKEQGCNISVRKGNEKTKNSRGRNAARDDDEDDEDD